MRDMGCLEYSNAYSCSFLQDLSNRELEIFFQENIAGKWFCGLDILN